MEVLVLSSILDFTRVCLWLLILMSIFGFLERIFAVQRQKFFRKDFLVDLLYYFISGHVPKLLLILPLALVGWLAHRVIPPVYYAKVDTLPALTRVIVALVIGEIGFYWGHRWSHEIPFLWKFHAIHHSAKEMDWLVSSRSHPVDMVFTRLCGFIPLYVVGLARPLANQLDAVTTFVILGSTIWGFFIHANVKWRFGPLEWLISTPAFHHWHHTLEAPHDKNYASMLPWLDLVFGTAYLPKKEWPAQYGCDTPVSPDLTTQLLDPILSR